MANKRQTANKGQPLALVTGASSGIGAAVASKLASSGYKVCATASRLENRDLDSRFVWYEFEGAQVEGLKKFIHLQSDLLSRIDLLVNNAGFGVFGGPEDLSSEDIRSQLQLMLASPIELCRVVAPRMRERRSGCIVNVSSLAAWVPLPWLATYCAAKAGLSAFTRNCALTETASDLRWIDLQLGDFRTAFNRNMRRRGEPVPSRKRAWEQLEAHLATAPEASRAAQNLHSAIHRGRSGTVYSGSWFQVTLAPFAARILPDRTFLALVRSYYKLPQSR